MSNIWIIKWANQLGITEPVNGSWIEAIARHLGEYGDKPHIHSIANSLGLTQPKNGSWLQAIAEHYGANVNDKKPWITKIGELATGSSDKFEFTIDTTKPGTASNLFKLDMYNTTGYDCTIEWGDGETTYLSAYNSNLVHTYATPGIYTVKIDGSFPAIYVNNGQDKAKWMSINNWGINAWVTFKGAFRGCSNLEVYATDIPNSANALHFDNAFNSCSSLTSFSMAGWDMSSCTTFGWGYTGAFYGCNSLTSFDFTGMIMNTTSNVQFREVFWGCSSLTTVTGFNTLNMSKVISMYYTFRGTKVDNLDLSGMDFSSCTDWNFCFGENNTMTNINVSNITFPSVATVSFQSMFQTTANLSTITGLETWTSVKFGNIISMFNSCKITGSLNLTGWDVSNVTSTSSTFRSTLLTSLDISGWDLSNCTTFGNKYAGMFGGSSSLTTLNVSNVTIKTDGSVIMYEPFTLLGTCDIIGLDTWNISTVSNMTDFMKSTTMTTVEYDKLLIAWDALDPIDSLAVNFGLSKYTLGGAAETARTGLITTDLWTITDGGGI